MALVAFSSAAASPDGPIDAKLLRAEGGKLRLEELRGRPLLVDFWATWCFPCREQGRILEELRGELGERDVSVLAVSLGETKKTVKAFLEANPAEVRVALDPYRVLADRIGIETVPSLALLDAEGRLVAVRAGSSSREEILELVGRLSG